MNGATNNRGELACYLSAFHADDTLIKVIPSFDYNGKMPLLAASGACGPFKAGIVTKVPMWIAILLHSKSLCTICPPDWLNKENLIDILAYERKETTLWNNDGSSRQSSNSRGETNGPTGGGVRLPFHYYEIASRLTSRSLSNTVITDKSVPLLVQDILEVRLDKLRQQFQQLLSESSASAASASNDGGGDDEDHILATNLMVSVNGIGSQELAVLKPFVIQALNDQAFLSSSSSSKSTTRNTDGKSTDNSNSNEAPHNQNRGRTSETSRSSTERHSTSSGRTDADEFESTEGNEKASDAGGGGGGSGTGATSRIRSRIPIRRFR